MGGFADFYTLIAFCPNVRLSVWLGLMSVWGRKRDKRYSGEESDGIWQHYCDPAESDRPLEAVLGILDLETEFGETVANLIGGRPVFVLLGLQTNAKEEIDGSVES